MSKRHFLVCSPVHLLPGQRIEWPEDIRYLLSKPISQSEVIFRKGGSRRITRFEGGYRLVERNHGTHIMVRLEGGFSYRRRRRRNPIDI